LYHEYPIGSFLVWETASDTFLLDGQQRITSLYGVIRGELPKFSDGDLDSFLKLYFNVETEEFEFYGITKMQHNPRWISVTKAMQNGTKELKPLINDSKYDQFVDRVNRFTLLKGRDFHIETISGSDWTLDEVVRIFNQINSGGTKLSKADLALAKISAKWPQARDEMQIRLSKWSKDGYKFNLDWLLRCINAIVTNQSEFQFIAEVSAEDFQDGLERAEKHIDNALTILRSHLGLVDSSVLRSPNSIPAIVRYFDKINGIPDYQEQCRLLYWYVFSALRGRYSSSSETAIRQDLLSIKDNADPVIALIRTLEEEYGDLKLHAYHFDAATSRSRYFPMLYMMTCVHGARDFCGGFKLSKMAVGPMANLERHHLFPKSQLHKHGIRNVRDVNALANFTFLTAPCNAEISNSLPEVYFPQYEAKPPGVLASHWIPTNPELWRIENYHEFLAARRELLAQAANDFLDQLLHGTLAEAEVSQVTFEQVSRRRPIHIASDEEEAELYEAMAWMEAKELPRGELGYEIVADNGDLLATLDLAWPEGIQTGLGQAVALLIGEDDETLKIASSRGFTCFTSLADLQLYVRDEILGEREPA